MKVPLAIRMLNTKHDPAGLYFVYVFMFAIAMW